MKNNPLWTRIAALTLFFYLLSLLFSLPVSRLAGQSLSTYAGDSMWLERLRTGPDALFLSDFIPNAAESFRSLPVVFLPLAAAYFLLHLIGSAGIMKTLAEPGQPAGPAFASGVLRHGFRFLLLFLLFIPQYLLAGGAIVGLFALVHHALPENTSEMFPLGFDLLRILVAGLGLLLIQSVHYSARAELVVRPLPVLRAALSAWRRGPRRIGSGYVRFLALSVAGGAAAMGLTALGWEAYRFYPLLVVLLQGAVFTMTGTRVLAHALFVSRCQGPAPADARPAGPAGALPADVIAAGGVAEPQPSPGGREDARLDDPAIDPVLGTSDRPNPPSTAFF